MLTILPVKGIPDIKKGDDIGRLIAGRVEDQGDQFQQGDIAVISQKIVSKAEGRVLPLSKIIPSDFAKTIANETGKDPRQVEVVLRESKKIIRMRGGHIITETFGRAWRIGQVNFAIGISGMRPIHDYRGTKDMYRRTLQVTEIAVADELASAAELVMNKADRIPVVIVRGYKAAKGRGRVKDLIRPEEFDLFR